MSTWQTKHVDSNSYILSELVQVFFQIPFLFLEGWNAKSSLCHWRRNPCQDGYLDSLSCYFFSDL